MGDFYGIKPGTTPGGAEADDGRFMSVTDLPGHTVRNMAMFMDKLRGMQRMTRWRSRPACATSLP